MYWLSREWLSYVFNDTGADKDYGPERWPTFLIRYAYWTYRVAGYASRFVCRWRGHPAGIVYYSQGWEPDYHCKGCGQNLN